MIPIVSIRSVGLAGISCVPLCFQLIGSSSLMSNCLLIICFFCTFVVSQRSNLIIYMLSVIQLPFPPYCCFLYVCCFSKIKFDHLCVLMHFYYSPHPNLFPVDWICSILYVYGFSKIKFDHLCVLMHFYYSPHPNLFPD